jgi:hypothetical protein
MPAAKPKRRRKLGKREVKLFLAMCAIALCIGALLTVFYGRSDDPRRLMTERLMQEYKARTGRPTVDPATRRRIESAADYAAGDKSP